MGARASLGHALLNEGLAEHFEEEMGFACPFYAIAVEREPFGNWHPSDGDFETAAFDYNAWFFGKKDDPAFPRHGGYSLGYAICAPG